MQREQNIRVGHTVKGYALYGVHKLFWKCLVLQLRTISGYDIHMFTIKCTQFMLDYEGCPTKSLLTAISNTHASNLQV